MSLSQALNQFAQNLGRYPLPMQVKANAVASAADIVFFFFINYIFLNLFFEVKQMPSSLKNTHSQLR